MTRGYSVDGDAIRRARRRAGMTLAQVAERLGVAKMTVCRWETGIRTPSVAHLGAMSVLYGADLREWVR